MIGHPLLSFTSGVTVTPTVTTPAPEVGKGRPKRRRVIIDDVIYEGTDAQIEAKLWELVQQRPQPVVEAKPVKAKKQAKPVQLRQDYVPAPVAIFMPRFQEILADTYRHDDAFTRAILHEMLRRMEDEDDVETLLLSMH